MLFLRTFIKVLWPAEAPEVLGSQINPLIVYKMLKFWTKQYLEHMYLERPTHHDLSWLAAPLPTNTGRLSKPHGVQEP